MCVVASGIATLLVWLQIGCCFRIQNSKLVQVSCSCKVEGAPFPKPRHLYSHTWGEWQLLDLHSLNYELTEGTLSYPLLLSNPQ